MDGKLNMLENYFRMIGRIYIDIDNEISLNKIYKLFVDKVMFEPMNNIEMFYLGRYYHIIDDDDVNYQMAKKYYIISANNNNHNSMLLLSNIYYKEHNNKLAKQYYIMSKDMFDNGFVCDYKNHGKLLNYIELCMNNNNNNNNVWKRDKWITKINNYAINLQLYAKYCQKKFIQLVKNFDFMESDILGEELKNLIKN